MGELEIGECKVSIDLEQSDGHKFRMELGTALDVIIDVKNNADMQPIGSGMYPNTFTTRIDPSVDIHLSKVQKDLKNDCWMIYSEIQKELK